MLEKAWYFIFLHAKLHDGIFVCCFLELLRVWSNCSSVCVPYLVLILKIIMFPFILFYFFILHWSMATLTSYYSLFRVKFSHFYSKHKVCPLKVSLVIDSGQMKHDILMSSKFRDKLQLSSRGHSVILLLNSGVNLASKHGHHAWP